MDSGAHFGNRTIDFNDTINATISKPPFVVSPYYILVRHYLWYLTVVIYPVIAVCGLTGNVLSVIVLVKSGLNKPSNVLLVSLCIADSFSLCSVLNIPNIMQYFPVKAPSWFFSWEYPEDVAYVLFVMTLCFQFVYYYGGPLSATLCAFITLERLVAVFYPLHFNSVVTAKRAWMAVITVFVLWIPYAVSMATIYRFGYMYIAGWNLHFGYIILEMDWVIWFIHTNIAIPLSRHVTLIIVMVGSVLISLRVAMTMKKRKEITLSSIKKATTSNKTTTTLLAVCVMFSVTRIASLAEYAVASFDWGERNEILIVYGILVLLETINSSCNFVIYITMNKKFRKIFKSMLH